MKVKLMILKCLRQRCLKSSDILMHTVSIHIYVAPRKQFSCLQISKLTQLLLLSWFKIRFQFIYFFRIINFSDFAPSQAEFFNNYMRDPQRPMSRDTSVKTPILPPTPKTPSSEDAPVLGIMSPAMPTPPGPMGRPWGQDPMMHMFGRGIGWDDVGP